MPLFKRIKFADLGGSLVVDLDKDKNLRMVALPKGSKEEKEYENKEVHIAYFHSAKTGDNIPYMIATETLQHFTMKEIFESVDEFFQKIYPDLYNAEG